MGQCMPTWMAWKYRMRYRAYRLGYSGAKGALDGLKACEADSSPVDKTTIETAPIDAPLFNHLSDQKQREINKYREDYRKYRLGYASGAKGEVADIFKRQLSRDEKCEAVEEILTRTTSQSSGTDDEMESLARTFSEPVPVWQPSTVKGLASHYSGIFSEALCKEVDVEDESKSMYFTLPKSVLPDPSAQYFQVPQMEDGTLELDAELLLSKTPLPKAAAEFSSIHVVQTSGVSAKITAASIKNSAAKIRKPCVLHDWPELSTDAKAEYD
ncbi:unnamed protein product, partial [Durusdinium trenchii]